MKSTILKLIPVIGLILVFMCGCPPNPDLKKLQDIIDTLKQENKSQKSALDSMTAVVDSIRQDSINVGACGTKPSPNDPCLQSYVDATHQNCCSPSCYDELIAQHCIKASEFLAWQTTGTSGTRTKAQLAAATTNLVCSENDYIRIDLTNASVILPFGGGDHDTRSFPSGSQYISLPLANALLAETFTTIEFYPGIRPGTTNIPTVLFKIKNGTSAIMYGDMTDVFP